MEEQIESINDVSVGQAINEIRDIMRDISSFVKELRSERDKTIEGIVLNREQVLEILNVSKSTLARWRQDRMIPYKVLKNNCSVYLYDELFVALKRGDFSARGFDRSAAIRRMKDFMTGRINGDIFSNDYLE